MCLNGISASFLSNRSLELDLCLQSICIAFSIGCITYRLLVAELQVKIDLFSAGSQSHYFTKLLKIRQN